MIESRQMDHLRVFHDVARALTSSLELEEILGAIMDKMAQFFGPERWSMLSPPATIAGEPFHQPATRFGTRWKPR